MSELIQRIKLNPHLHLVIAGASYTLLTSIASACLYYYFTQIVSNEFMHWQIIGYILLVAKGIVEYSEFFDEDSFYPLRDLLDYCAIVLVLPCYAAEMWLKTEMGPPELSAIFAGLGFLAAIMFVILEYRRQDLTDLAIYANAISLVMIASLSKNPFTFLATMIFTSGYTVFKRIEDQCSITPQDKFNFVLALFAVAALGSFDDNLINSIQDGISEGLKAIGLGGEGDE